MAFDKNIVSTKKQTNILRSTLMSHLPRIPPYLPHHRPLSASRLKKSVQFNVLIALPSTSSLKPPFSLVLSSLTSPICVWLLLCVFLLPRARWPVFFVFWREEKNIFTLSMPLRLSPCVVFAQVHCSGKFWKVLEAAELWKVRFSFPLNILHLVCTPPNTPRAPQTLGLATVRSFVCGRGGGCHNCHMDLRSFVRHVDKTYACRSLIHHVPCA